jgi:hypothetical protein
LTIKKNLIADLAVMMTDFKIKVFDKLLDDYEDPDIADELFCIVKDGIVSKLDRIENSIKNDEDVVPYLDTLKGFFWSYGLVAEGDEIAIFEQRFKNGESSILNEIEEYSKEFKKYVA